MAYIGNTVQNQGFSPAIDYFNGNGVTVTFTLSRPVASVAQMIVAVDNVIQNPSSAFGVVGNSITFTSAPLSGTNNIWVEYTSLITTYQGISQDPTVIGDIRATGGYLAEGDFGNSFIDGNLIDYVSGRGRFTVGELDDITFYHGGTGARSPMMDLYHAGGAKIYGTTALTLPVGTTAERPISPAAGMQRYNSTLNQFEFYQNGAWTQYNTSYNIEYLVVAGGAAGGGAFDNFSGTAGGGGAGGYRSSVTGESSGGGGSAESALSVSPGTAYTVIVGAGGAAATNSNTVGTAGSNSLFSSITSLGGGGGGGGNDGSGNPASGGCGGGGSGNYATNGASGTANQGYGGGNTQGTPNYPSGGGGGAGAVGVSGVSTQSGAGGAGVSSSITGSAVTRAGGGGGGGAASSTRGVGGSGGGGDGGNSNTNGTSGTANTGGGGGALGACNATGTKSAGSGGSGVVILRYLGAQRGTGGTVTSSGGYTIHTFTSSGTYTA